MGRHGGTRRSLQSRTSRRRAAAAVSLTLRESPRGTAPEEFHFHEDIENMSNSRWPRSSVGVGVMHAHPGARRHAGTHYRYATFSDLRLTRQFVGDTHSLPAETRGQIPGRSLGQQLIISITRACLLPLSLSSEVRHTRALRRTA